ncbi:MAG: adenylyl cyclase, partial [Gammaproteobacteria bacterium]|nr:adenylyl cyclase [Gammaproteobacteria bacterium]
MSLIKELKRRNVFKVGVAYLVVSWLIIQISALAVPALNLPAMVNTLVFYFLLIGFPVALLFAWAYELTPEGIKKSKHVESEASITHLTGRKIDFIIIGALILV